jgi:ribonuclease HI
LAKTELFTQVCEVHVGEAIGLLLALECVHQLHLGPIDFELDAKEVVDSLSSARQDVTKFGMIIHNYKTIIEQCYLNFSVEFVRRHANEAAHRLAKEATSSASFQILVEIPDCIKHILSNTRLDCYKI